MQDDRRISATQHGRNDLPECHAARSGGFAKLGLTVRATPRDACERFISILRDAGLVRGEVPYEELVDTRAVDAAEPAKVG